MFGLQIMNAQSPVDAVVWLVRDTCRLQDNPAFDRALEEAKPDLQSYWRLRAWSHGAGKTSRSG